MSQRLTKAQQIVDRILAGESADERMLDLRRRLPADAPLPPQPPGKTSWSEEALAERRAFLRERGFRIDALASGGAGLDPESLRGNIEGLVGYAQIPVGVIGPLRINGTEANGDFYVPLATTEGALVASYQRGSRLLSESGGATVICLAESVHRAPCFVFRNLAEAGRFCAYALPRFDELAAKVGELSRHAKLVDLRASLGGKETYLHFEYTTGDAAGQNMVTIATDALCKLLVEGSPIAPERWYIEGNMSGDKKATHLALESARGKKVVADVTIPAELIRKTLHAEPIELSKYWQVATVGCLRSGAIGMTGHAANALAALFIACGQDAACVSEASIGVTRMDVTAEGDFHASVDLPNLIVGTVGGGTHLPTAQECLGMLGCVGAGTARKFAEICAAVVLAGEISITGALASGEFSRAHALFGRKPK